MALLPYFNWRVIFALFGSVGFIWVIVWSRWFRNDPSEHPGVNRRLGTAATMFTLAAAWSTAIEMGGDHAGVVSAAMNTCGQIGSLLCPLLVAYSVEWFGSWDLPLYIMGGLFLAGMFFWLLIDPGKPVFAVKEQLSR